MDLQKIGDIILVGLLLKISLSLVKTASRDEYELRESSIARRGSIVRPNFGSVEYNDISFVHFDQSFLQKVFGYTDCVIQIENGENVEYLRIRNMTVREFNRIESSIFS